jgi:hypothetical protein
MPSKTSSIAWGSLGRRYRRARNGMGMISAEGCLGADSAYIRKGLQLN